jgi:hypothetical protein
MKPLLFFGKFQVGPLVEKGKFSILIIIIIMTILSTQIQHQAVDAFTMDKINNWINNNKHNWTEWNWVMTK